MRRILLFSVAIALLAPAANVHAQGREVFDRTAVPGHYTLGLYADAQGRSSEIVLKGDQSVCEAFIGITGDSTKVFSGISLRLELPRNVKIDGPVRWNNIPGLSQIGTPIDRGGLLAEFNQNCVEQRGPQPVMIGRIRFEVDEDFREGEVQVVKHLQHGVGVELCKLEDGWWPKPFADPVHLKLKRSVSLWARIRNLFR